jgi:hypothetical protein
MEVIYHQPTYRPRGLRNESWQAVQRRRRMLTPAETSSSAASSQQMAERPPIQHLADPSIRVADNLTSAYGQNNNGGYLDYRA